VSDLGVRLQLLIGPTIPVPAPYAVVDALDSLEVTNQDHERDGFQMSFRLGKDSLLDYGLLSSGLLDPPARVIVIVLINALPQVLIDGLITHHQHQPSNQPGQSRLTVTGEDISLQLGFEERSQTYPNQSDSAIVTRILGSYGLVPDVMPTSKIPVETEEVPSQQGTDLKYVQKLATENGFVFFVEPTDIPMVNRAYWGPDHRVGSVQRPLSMNMGAATNVERLDFTFDALRPEQPVVQIIDPIFGLPITIPIPTGFRPTLVGKPTTPLRKTITRDTAGLSAIDAALKVLEILAQSSDSIDAQGELDALQYGRALRARNLVAVRGAGQAYDGTYYVKRVTHNIQRGQYRQSFGLTREGRGALSLQVGS
jgi:hypothetical protein